MEIQPIETKAGKIRFFVQNSNKTSVCWFDGLFKAALVARFLSGANMSLDERAQAVEAIKAFDALLEEHRDDKMSGSGRK